jgi:hypothetical protein
MKKIFLFFCLAIFSFSCKKNSNSSGVPPTDLLYYLSSVRTIGPQTQIIDSFIYDSNHNVALLTEYVFDTSGGSPVSDSIRVVFNFSTNSLPQSYTFTDYAVGNINDVHQLFYDGQNRIVEDTSMSGSGFVNHFSYPANSIASILLFDATSGNNQVDSLLLANENISHEVIYYPNNSGTGDTLSASLGFGFSVYPNPEYNPQIAGTVAPLLYLLMYDGFGGYYDCISKNAVNSIYGFRDGPPTQITYSIIPDAKGRVARIVHNGGPGNYGNVFTYYP